MILSIKPNIFFFLTISWLLHFTVNAQPINSIVSFANQQFENGNYAIAEKEYNRALFFGYKKQDSIALLIGHCYQLENNYEKAGSFYDQAFFLSKNDSIKNEAVLGKAFCLIMKNEFILAQSELFNINEPFCQEQQASLHFLNGISLWGLQKDSLAFSEFKLAIKSSGINDEGAITALENEFIKVAKLNKRYSPKRAYIMSAFLPGSGQLLSGEIKQGVNSIALLSLLFYASTRIAATYSFADAIFTLIPWLQRYYIGGMDKSKSLANQKIESMRYQSYLKILKLTAPENYK